MSTVTIPVTVSAGAAAYVAEIGMEQPFRQMIEHIQETVCGLRRIRAELQEPNDMGPNPWIIFEVSAGDPMVEGLKAEKDFGYWKYETFPPEVAQHFILMADFE